MVASIVWDGALSNNVEKCESCKLEISIQQRHFMTTVGSWRVRIHDMCPIPEIMIYEKPRPIWGT
jgi:hypothetical protein